VRGGLLFLVSKQVLDVLLAHLLATVAKLLAPSRQRIDHPDPGAARRPREPRRCPPPGGRPRRRGCSTRQRSKGTFEGGYARQAKRPRRSPSSPARPLRAFAGLYPGLPRLVRSSDGFRAAAHPRGSLPLPAHRPGRTSPGAVETAIPQGPLKRLSLAPTRRPR
jgi:hypothetical protein